MCTDGVDEIICVRCSNAVLADHHEIRHSDQACFAAHTATQSTSVETVQRCTSLLARQCPHRALFSLSFASYREHTRRHHHRCTSQHKMESRADDDSTPHKKGGSNAQTIDASKTDTHNSRSNPQAIDETETRKQRYESKQQTNENNENKPHVLNYELTNEAKQLALPPCKKVHQAPSSIMKCARVCVKSINTLVDGKPGLFVEKDAARGRGTVQMDIGKRRAFTQDPEPTLDQPVRGSATQLQPEQPRTNNFERIAVPATRNCMSILQVSDNTKQQVHNNNLKPQTSQSSADSSDPPDSFCCPITLEWMRDPVLHTDDGMTYERKAIQEWLLDHAVLPTGQATTQAGVLVPNRVLQNMIGEWRAKNGL